MIAPDVRKDDREIAEVLSRVRTWRPEVRVSLARQILETLERPEISEPPRRMRLDQVLGLLKSDAPPPTDEECERIIEEERIRKYT
jgi:hypothetical protein